MSLPATASAVTVTEAYVDAAGEEVDGVVTPQQRGSCHRAVTCALRPWRFPAPGRCCCG